MSATDELRRMLDERGVEWESKDVEGVSDFHDTRWNAYDVQWCYVEFVGNNYTKLKPSSEFHCTPEQAIAATLGGDDKSRWAELFGTPERAARTLEEFELDQLNWCRGTEYCESCPYEFDRYGCYLPDGFELLEWLRGDA